jgi:amino acid transporter
MNKKLFALIASLSLIAIGCAILYFAQFNGADVTGFAITMFGAGLAVNQLWNGRKPEAKTWLVVLGIVLVGLGSFFAGLFAVMSIEQIKTYIGLIFAVILFVAGLVTVYIGNKTKKLQ